MTQTREHALEAALKSIVTEDSRACEMADYRHASDFHPLRASICGARAALALPPDPAPVAAGEWRQWTDAQQPETIIRQNGSVVARCVGDQGRQFTDARLIAAAPDMLAVLKNAAALIGESKGVDGFHLNGDLAEWGEFDLPNEIEAAIARATGKEG
jgi:hypothetical protein